MTFWSTEDACTTGGPFGYDRAEKSLWPSEVTAAAPMVANALTKKNILK